MKLRSWRKQPPLDLTWPYAGIQCHGRKWAAENQHGWFFTQAYACVSPWRPVANYTDAYVDNFRWEDGLSDPIYDGPEALDMFARSRV